MKKQIPPSPFVSFLLKEDYQALKNKAAQQGVQLTALRRGLALSLLFNVVLLAVLLFTVGGN